MNEPTGMRVLLTGASGFLGQHLLRRLHQRGIDTVVAGRRLPACWDTCNFIQADLLDTHDFSPLLDEARATHLLHLAWYAEHGAYWTSPLNLRWTETTVRLTEAFCRAGGQKLVLAGTCAEYDWSHGYCREDGTPLQPATLYGVAKDATRRLVKAVCEQHGMPWAWGRIFLPFGAGEDERRLLPSLGAVFRGERPPFGVNAAAWRDFIHADDIADAFLIMLTGEICGPCNIASGQPVSLADVVRRLAELHGRDPRMVFDLSSERPGEPLLLVGEPGHLRAGGWVPAHTLDDYLISTTLHV